MDGGVGGHCDGIACRRSFVRSFDNSIIVLSINQFYLLSISLNHSITAPNDGGAPQSTSSPAN